MGINARQLKAAIKAIQQMNDVVAIGPSQNGGPSQADFNITVSTPDVVIESLEGDDALADLFHSVSNKPGDTL